MREAFEYIIISAPTLNRKMDATSIGKSAECVVLIVEAKRRGETVWRAMKQLEGAPVRLLKRFLDQRTFPIPEGLIRGLSDFP